MKTILTLISDLIRILITLILCFIYAPLWFTSCGAKKLWGYATVSYSQKGGKLRFMVTMILYGISYFLSILTQSLRWLMNIILPYKTSR